MSAPIIEEAGTIETVFAHRFVLKRRDGTRLLADLGPAGARAYRLVEGAVLAIEGEAKASELKVHRILPENGEPILVARDGRGEEIDVAAALAALRSAGLEPIGEPRRGPRHVEVLIRRGGDLFEVHVAPDSKLGREKPADRAKWAADLPSN